MQTIVLTHRSGLSEDDDRDGMANGIDIERRGFRQHDNQRHLSSRPAI